MLALAPIGIASAEKSDKQSVSELRGRYDGWEEGYEQIVRAYGEREAKIWARITRGVINKFERGNITAQEAVNDVVERVIRHPQMSEMATDARDHLNWQRSRTGRIKESTEKIRPVPVTTQNEGVQLLDTSTQTLDKTEEDSSSTWVNATDVTASSPANAWGPGIMRGFASCTGPGSAEYTIRLYSDNFEFISGNVRIDVDYHARGTTNAITGSASTEIFAFIRDENGNIVRARLEDLGWSNGSRTKSAQFYLAENEGYDVGIELQGSANAIVETAYSDYYNTHFDLGQRRIQHEAGDFKIFSLD